MTIYTVYSPPLSTDSIQGQQDKTVLIPEAPTLLALIFPLIWLLWYRLWWAALFYMLTSLLFMLLLPSELSLIIAALTALPGLFLFLEGQQLRRTKLERRGWNMVATVEDQDIESAEYRYFYFALDKNKSTEEAHFKPSKGPSIKKLAPTNSDIQFFSSMEHS